MKAHIAIAALLRIWPAIPFDMRSALLLQLRAFLDAQSEAQREHIVSQIEQILVTVSNLLSLYYEAYDDVSSERGAGAKTDPGPKSTRLLALAEVRAQVQTLLAESQGRYADKDNRVINAWVEGLPSDAPLELKKNYKLLFNVADPRSDSRAPITPFAPDVIPSDREEVGILVILVTEDFIVHGDDQATLTVPRFGASKSSACFGIEPKKQGRGVITALFITNERGCFQRMTLIFQVGTIAAAVPACEIQPRGLTFDSSLERVRHERGRRISVMILRRDTGYQFIVHGGGVMQAFLKLSEEHIAALANRAREMFRKIVYTSVHNQYVYQLENTAVLPDIHAATLKTMAEQGTLMYLNLFYGPHSGSDGRAMGDLLRKLARDDQLRIEIVAEHFTFPWSMLYSRDDLKSDLSNVDPDGFWGFKHVIEYSPYFANPTPISFVPEIAVANKLELSFIYNTNIDTQMKHPIVKRQREFFQTMPGIKMTEYQNVSDLYALLNNPDHPAQVLYFYCHAESNLPGEKGGLGQSKIILSDGEATLDDLNFAAPPDKPPLKAAPLAFMNCCQSAKLSPYLYDGLAPYLIAKGARGVIGTEVDTPAPFAAEFAREFFTRFVTGDQMLGDILLDLRREYLRNRNNVMGLVYALHSSEAIVVRRAENQG